MQGSMLDTIYGKLESQKAALIILSPDAIQANMIRPITDFLFEKIGLFPRYKFSISHTNKTIREFYKNSNIGKRRFEILDQLFLSGESIGFVYEGENLYETLTLIKGLSHPAKCKTDQIRGFFWCDSKVFNLIHSSDNSQEALRELEILSNSIKVSTFNPKSSLGQSQNFGYEHSGLYNLSKFISNNNSSCMQRINSMLKSKAEPLFRANYIFDRIVQIKLDRKSNEYKFFSSLRELDINEAKSNLKNFQGLSSWELATIESFVDGIIEWNLDYFEKH
jgi:nucleoside diphosphate kinase